VSSGTAGLHAAVIAAGIQDGDNVITTPFSFVASANCILYERANPIFVDIDSETLNIDPERIEDKVKEIRATGREVKAILPVHIFGQPCDMDPIMEIAERYGLVVLEDACEAIGAEYHRRKVGTFGLASVFSFYPNKQITLGEGGVIVTDDEEFAETCRSIRNQGRGRDGTWLQHVRLGYNYRLAEMAAAMGVAQLERIDELLEKRELVARRYTDQLSEIPGLRVPSISPETTRMSWFVYVIQLDANLDRERIMEHLEARGIATRPYFASIHLQPFYQSLNVNKKGSLPVTEMVASTSLALPFYGNMTEEEVDFVCKNLVQTITNNSCRSRS